jgi:predicted nucleic acid-binding protein
VLVVSDTSPIRALATINLLHALHVLYGQVIVPPAVAAELQAPTSSVPPLDVTTLSFVRIIQPTDQSQLAELRALLDPGEAEAIALALELKADALLIDERNGRREARRRGVELIGVLGVLLACKKAGLIDRVAPLLVLLEQTIRFRLAAHIRDSALRRAGEL